VDWTFLRQRPGGKRRDPTQGEFFANDRPDSLADGLIRESIQNSLDAGTGERVSVAIHTNHRGVTTGTLFSSLGQHLTAIDPHLGSLVHEPCRYLIVEDFETTGLRGDPQQFFRDETTDDRNEFYFFFRAEGRSSKAGGKRGSWGVGKYTFARASRIRTIFGITRRDDGRALAMGQSILVNHQAQGLHYEPDGTWGRVIDVQGDDATVPFEPGDPQFDELHSHFSISRSDETGLSIVVPFLDEGVDVDVIRAAVLRNYGVAIASGGLVVQLTSDTGDAEYIDQDSLVATIKKAKTGGFKDIEREVRLAEHLRTHEPIVALEPVGSHPQWNTYEMAPTQQAALRNALEREKIFSVRVPVVVDRKSDNSPVESWFDIAFEPATGERSIPVFYRRGIRISDAGRGRHTAGAHALVTATDGPLATMLGFAEGPAHTDWSASTDRFTGQYSHGRDWISFVKRAPAEVLRLVWAGTVQENRTAAASFFALPPTNAGARKATKIGTPEGETGIASIRANAKPQTTVITKAGGTGFRLRFNELNKADTEYLIRAAYDTTRGDPFTNWSPLDFNLTELRLDIDGIEVLDLEPHAVRVRVLSAEGGTVEIRGFDRFRDLIVRADPVSKT
jgi:hypothetical protein